MPLRSEPLPPPRASVKGDANHPRVKRVPGGLMRQAAGGYETGGAGEAGWLGHSPRPEQPAERAPALRSVISGLLRRALEFRYSWQSVLWPPNASGGPSPARFFVERDLSRSLRAY